MLRIAPDYLSRTTLRFLHVLKISISRYMNTSIITWSLSNRSIPSNWCLVPEMYLTVSLAYTLRSRQQDCSPFSSIFVRHLRQKGSLFLSPTGLSGSVVCQLNPLYYGSLGSWLRQFLGIFLPKQTGTRENPTVTAQLIGMGISAFLVSGFHDEEHSKLQLDFSALFLSTNMCCLLFWSGWHV